VLITDCLADMLFIVADLMHTPLLLVRHFRHVCLVSSMLTFSFFTIFSSFSPALSTAVARAFTLTVEAGSYLKKELVT